MNLMTRPAACRPLLNDPFDPRDAFHLRVFADLARFLPLVTRRLQMPLLIQGADKIELRVDHSDHSGDVVRGFQAQVRSDEGEGMSLPVTSIDARTIAFGTLGTVRAVRWATRWVFANEVRHHPWSLGMFELVVRRWRAEHWSKTPRVVSTSRTQLRVVESLT